MTTLGVSILSLALALCLRVPIYSDVSRGGARAGDVGGGGGELPLTLTKTQARRALNFFFQFQTFSLRPPPSLYDVYM